MCLPDDDVAALSPALRRKPENLRLAPSKPRDDDVAASLEPSSEVPVEPSASASSDAASSSDAAASSPRIAAALELIEAERDGARAVELLATALDLAPAARSVAAVREAGGAAARLYVEEMAARGGGGDDAAWERRKLAWLRCAALLPRNADVLEGLGSAARGRRLAADAAFALAREAAAADAPPAAAPVEAWHWPMVDDAARFAFFDAFLRREAPGEAPFGPATLRCPGGRAASIVAAASGDRFDVLAHSLVEPSGLLRRDALQEVEALKRFALKAGTVGAPRVLPSAATVFGVLVDAPAPAAKFTREAPGRPRRVALDDRADATLRDLAPAACARLPALCAPFPLLDLNLDHGAVAETVSTAPALDGGETGDGHWRVAGVVLDRGRGLPLARGDVLDVHLAVRGSKVGVLKTVTRRAKDGGAAAARPS
ncbi:protein-arginine omega-N asymmetric methyltransferase [Aureococcus anophagefferens]|nr:protein-arginine omega-N asymmetric methyltransferase [Aureococcus anophagefferens]